MVQEDVDFEEVLKVFCGGLKIGDVLKIRFDR